MTTSAPSPTRRLPVLSIISVVVVVVSILPTLAIVAVGFLPDMMTVFWLLLVVFPVTVLGGLIGGILAIIGLILDIRARRTLVWAIIGIVLALIATLVPLSFLMGWWS